MDISSFGKRQYAADILYLMSGSANVVHSHSSIISKINPQKKLHFVVTSQWNLRNIVSVVLAPNTFKALTCKFVDYNSHISNCSSKTPLQYLKVFRWNSLTLCISLPNCKNEIWRKSLSHSPSLSLPPSLPFSLSLSPLSLYIYIFVCARPSSNVIPNLIDRYRSNSIS